MPPPPSGKVTSEATTRLPRQGVHQTRYDLLNAAVRIVNRYILEGPREDDPLVDPLPFLRLDEVLEVATELARERLVKIRGVSPDEPVAPLTGGAFYRAFATESQDGDRSSVMAAFKQQVAKEIVDDPLLADAEAYVDFSVNVAKEGGSFPEAVRQAIPWERKRWSKTPASTLLAALALHARDPEIAQWASPAYRRHLTELTHIYEELLKFYGRRMRPGLKVEHMAAAVSDQIRGSALGSRFAPENRDETIEIDADGTGAKEWHVCALAALAIYESFTEPNSPTSASADE